MDHNNNETVKKKKKRKIIVETTKIIDQEKKLLMGDLIETIRKENTGIQGILERVGTRNNNVERLIKVGVENYLVIANTKFVHKNIYKYTRQVHSRNEETTPYFFLIN